MPKDANPYLSRGNFFQYFFLHFTSTPEILTFSDNNKIYQFFPFIRFLQSLYQCIDICFALGDQNIFSAGSYSAVQSNIAGIAPHHFDHKNAIVSIHCVPYLINGFHRGVDGSIETDRKISTVNIFIDRTGKANTGNAKFFMKFHSPAK